VLAELVVVFYPVESEQISEMQLQL
jgi:hypothetical protein